MIAQLWSIPRRRRVAAPPTTAADGEILAATVAGALPMPRAAATASPERLRQWEAQAVDIILQIQDATVAVTRARRWITRKARATAHTADTRR